MRNDQSIEGGKSRRQFFRTAAVMGAAATLPLLARDKAQAAGRHSDPYFCEPVCLLRGSRIETSRGDVEIESLKLGDLIRTEDGAFKPVKWVGRKVFRKAPEAAWATTVDPVRISKDAVAPGVPSRDVFVSPRHALFIDGYLIPASYLVNGRTISQGVHKGDVVEYLHVECDSHDVMFTEGLAVETLQVHEAAETFSNFAERSRLYGHDVKPMAAYAPVLAYWSAKDDVVARLRQLGSVLVDVRDRIQVARDRLAARADDLQNVETV